MKLSKTSNIIKDIRKRKKQNINDNKIVIEDLSILFLLKQLPYKIEKFFYCEEIEYKKETLELIEQLKDKAEEVYTVSYNTYQLIVNKKNSIGLLAIIEMNMISLNDIDLKKCNSILVTDGLENPGNLGTIYRTADATGFNIIINIDLKTSINHPKTIASSRGMVLVVPSINTTYEDVSDFLLKNDFDIYIGEPELGVSCFETKFSKKTAIVVGSERFGVNHKWSEEKHRKIKIPMAGTMRSLNVSVAASVLMYQYWQDLTKNK